MEQEKLHETRSLLEIKQRYKRAMNSQNAVGINMKGIKMTRDVEDFITRHEDEFKKIIRDNGGKIINSTIYFKED
jgi:hypothetical protein